MRRQKRTAPISRKDRAFINDLLAEYEVFIKKYSMRFASSDIPLDDIQQEAKIRLMLQIDDLRGLSHNQRCAFIATAIKFAFLDLYRKEKKHAREVPLDNILAELLGEERDLVPDLFLSQEMLRLRNSLTPRQWTALKGKYLFGYSQAELGELLDMAPDSVRMFLCRTRRQAREILSPEKATGGGDNE